MKNIIFIAPPASGKGTQSELLKEKYGFIHISTGDMLREEINSGSSLSDEVKNIVKQGQLVSDEIILQILENKLNTIKGKPFVLDGCPRTMNQANHINDLFNRLDIKDFIVLYLNLDEKTAMERSLGRLVCSCGKSYNIYDEKLRPKVDNKCDSCSKTLLKRSDDTEELFKERFKSYIDKTKPVLDYYDNLGMLKYIDASINREYTFSQIEEIINES